MLKLKRKDGSKLIITEHAIKRAKDRANISEGCIGRMCKKALSMGIGYNNAEGELLNFIKSKYQAYFKADNIKIYGYVVYVLKGNVLLTVLDLPEHFRQYWNAYSKTLDAGRELR